MLPSFYIPIVVSEPHDLLGNMLSLVLYSERDIYPNRTKLIQMLKESLKSHELPHKFYSTDEVIFTQTQKIDRNKVTKSLGKMRLL